MLTGKRSIMVTGDVRTLRTRPDSTSPAVARIEVTVIGKLLACPKSSGWCRVQIEGRKGWLSRGEMWGVYKDETID
jgi:SH3-like domain-containing protein